MTTYRESSNIQSDQNISDSDRAILDKVLRWLRQAEGSDSEVNWLTEAEEDYDFYAGDQDSVEVLNALAEAKRPASVYNQIKPKVDVVVGLAGQNRQLPTAFPVEINDEALTELANRVIKFFRRESGLSDNEVVCFEHTVKSGRALLYFYIDNENPFEPAIKCTFIHGRNFKLDPRSISYDMSDARFLFIDFWYDKDTIKTKYPDFDFDKVSQLASDGSSISFYDAIEDTYRVTECWYKEAEEVWWVQNPLKNGAIEKLSESDYTDLRDAVRTGQARLPNGEVVVNEQFEGIKGWATVYKYIIFSNDYVFARGRSKLNLEGFPAVLYGAYKHDKENRWFGLITMMKDPQIGINTMRRQMQHLLQTAPKGLMIHETGAIIDIDYYEKHSSEPNFHLEVSSGALEKVKFTDQPTISPVYGQLMEVDQQVMKDVSGIQNDTLGIQTYSREPGITTQLRQGQNIAILYILLDNFKKSRLLSTKIMFSMVQQYITTARIIRIEGQEGQKLMEINTQSNPNAAGFNDITAGKYDFYVDEGIETVNSRNTIAQMLVEMSHNNPGAIPFDVILDYSGMPYTVVQKVKQYTQAQQESAAKAENDKMIQEQVLKSAELENAKYIAIINNLAKLYTVEKQVDSNVLQTLLSGLSNNKKEEKENNDGGSNS